LKLLISISIEMILLKIT